MKISDFICLRYLTPWNGINDPYYLGTVHLIFSGGGGGLGIFSKKNVLALILTKKIILLNGTVKQNNLSPIV